MKIAQEIRHNKLLQGGTSIFVWANPKSKISVGEYYFNVGEHYFNVGEYYFSVGEIN